MSLDINRESHSYSNEPVFSQPHTFSKTLLTKDENQQYDG